MDVIEPAIAEPLPCQPIFSNQMGGVPGAIINA